MENNSDLNKFSQDIQNNLRVQADEIQKVLVAMERRCFSRARDNDETFVDCMFDATHKIEKEQRDLELRTAFFQAQNTECILNSDQSNESIKKCRNSTIANLQFAFSTFIDNLQF